ncbi:glycosyltransferase family 2 protein [Acinetobacter bereziniae]|uniref:glycosyltransferase family 2 protein n=1 Tax=Acinetobacter bereziniae TaxID=106648 RepID=UPI0019025D85|nr:glycosyltransferase family 2 protein [Acinetobacter bereziniae]MBJ8445340.1 glycosyltransferase family 2 protein [Acinetobacter bereziniae]
MFGDVDVSIIIVNYNTNDLVIQCINSVLLHTKNIEYEIIVVDNNSPDRKIERLNEIFPNVKLILNNSNSGFGAANNLGARFACGKYIFLLNSDTLLIDNSIKILYEFIRQNSESVGACGGNLCDENLKPGTSFSRYMPSILLDIDSLFFNSISKIINKGDIFYSRAESPFKILGNISGADLMLSKKIFDELGGFDESFFMYYEETDLLFRLRKKGYQTYIVPKSKIIHLEGASEEFKPVKWDWSYESKQKYYRKNKSNFELKLSDVIFKIIIIQRLLIFKLFHDNEKYNYWLSLKKWSKTKKNT